LSSEALRPGDARRRPAPRMSSESTDSRASLSELDTPRLASPDAALPQNRERVYAYRDSIDAGDGSFSEPLEGSTPAACAAAAAAAAGAAAAGAGAAAAAASSPDGDDDCERIAAHLRTPTARRKLFADRGTSPGEEKGEDGAGMMIDGRHLGEEEEWTPRPWRAARDLDERCGLGSSAAITDAVFADDPATLMRVASMEDFAIQRYRQRRRVNTEEGFVD
jgi:hypothetical protein